MTAENYLQNRLLTILSMIFMISISACGYDDEEVALESPTLISTANATSHRAGQDCRSCSCHNQSDQDILNGAFTVSGTVYDYATVNDQQPVIYDNAVVRFYTQPNGEGELSVSLPVDSSGNFYTTETIDTNFPVGLYPMIEDLASNRKVFMPKPIAPVQSIFSLDSCNFCHNNGEPAPIPEELPRVCRADDETDTTPANSTSTFSTRLNIGIISFNGGISHNAGQDCFSSTCHAEGGDGPKFTTAGTVYHADNPAIPYDGADAAIGIYTMPCMPEQGFCTDRATQPSSVATLIEIDQNGNFYTTQPVDWASGMYASVESYDLTPFQTVRNTKHMDNAQTTSGRCLDCHDGGATQANITIN